MRLKSLALAGAVLFSMIGCYSAPVIPPQGWVYTDIEAPIDIEMRNEPISGLKSGETSSFSVLGLVSWGDASIHGAAEDGGLTTVEHVDYAFNHVLGIYQTFTIRAYGK